MPSLAIVLPWAVAIISTLTIYGFFVRHDAPARLSDHRRGLARGLWDDGAMPAPVRVVVAGKRLYVRRSHRRPIALSPDTTTSSSTSSRTEGVWKITVGDETAALIDADHSIEGALAASPPLPARPGLRARFFLHAPRWAVSAFLGSLVLGIGMTVLTTAAEHHRVPVTHIITTPDDSYDCVVSWPGKQARGPHVTACPDDESQRVGDTISIVRLPASDYVIALDGTGSSYVSTLAFCSALFFLLVSLVAGLWPAVLPRRRGTYGPIADAEAVPSSSEHATSPDHESFDTSLTTPAGWSSALAYPIPEAPPAHSGSLGRRLVWRFNTLPLPWISTWASLLAYTNLNGHRTLLLPVLVVAVIFVIIGLLRTLTTWIRINRAPASDAPRRAYAYVRLPLREPKRTAVPTTALLLFDPDDEEGAWLVDVDGSPEPQGTVELVGSVENLLHPRITISGVEFETPTHPEWVDIEDLTAIQRDVILQHRIDTL